MFPHVSVVMPVYNREKVISSAIESILKQTFENFELIIIDDGSSDSTVQIINSFKDPRIILIQHKENKGVAAARNMGYRTAKGRLIAIADSDDINHEDRLLKQVEYLETHHDVDVVSCWCQSFGDGIEKVIYKCDETDEKIRAGWIFNSNVTSFMMFRRLKLKGQNLIFHNDTYVAAVDYQWYTALPKSIRIACVQEVLYYYRRHKKQISTDGYSIQQSYADQIRLEQLKLIGLEPSKDEFSVHHILIEEQSNFDIDEKTWNDIIKWCEKIKKANDSKMHFSQQYLDEILSRKLRNLFINAPFFNSKIYNMLHQSLFNVEIYDNSFNYNPEKVKLISREMNEKKIIIFGAKYMAYKILKALELGGINIECFVDNNSMNRGENIEQYMINSPKDVKFSDKIVVVSVLSESRYKIKEQLLQMGVPNKSIYLIDDLR
ncbi:glycosyltransferase involved in cell wall biosynthesis [Sporosarcina luteola]|nr:glycosyltransferase involved in cell wall biosynthesis [Sporosarcina luteola]